MIEKIRSKRTSRYLILVLLFLLIVTISLGFLLVRQSKSSIITLIQTRMLDIANTAAAMIDGDVLKSITPEDEGTADYAAIMRTLTYFQDNIDLKYIYCIRDMGDGTFTFGLDPTVEDPGEFGSPIVFTDALYKASQGTASADETPYHDAWGSFYSAYSPVLDARGDVAGIVAVDFSAEWYNRQLTSLTRTTLIVALLSVLVGGGIAVAVIARSEKKIGSIQGQLNEMATMLMHEMGNDSATEEKSQVDQNQREEGISMDTLEKQISSMQMELRTQIAQVHGQANTDELTGVKSKHAYFKTENELDEKLKNGSLSDFAIVVCDVNGLKKINDTQGHKAGDEYIRRACKMICDVFSHSPVYRVGGDEFVALLTGRDYGNRSILMRELHQLSSAHIATDEAIVSAGLAEYDPDRDHSVREIFERADAIMYQDKTLLKSLGAVIRDDESNHENDDGEVIQMRKHILIADDIETNREMLGDLLADDYDIFYASDGVETLEMLRKHKDEIALLILDLYMPNMTGREVMREMQVDEELMLIPIIVLTVDQDAELDSLKTGAMDFISKPYPDIDIVKARIAKCIELSENRDLIRRTERDKLTGLYNVDYFIRYVNLLDRQSKGAAFDAFVCDVNRFHAINEQYGRQFGDLVLRSIGIGIKKLSRKTGGIGCRKGGDTFLLYCPHREDYEQLIGKFTADLYVEKDTAEKVTLRFGVFANAEQETDVERRFVYAGIAAEIADHDPDRICGYYDA